MKRDMTGGGVVHRRHGRARAPSAARCRSSAWSPAAENSVVGQRAATRRRGPPLRRPHHRGHQHRRRGPAGAGRRAGLRRRRARARPCVVDVATLTGAIKVALGQQVGGLFANDDALADALLARRAPARASRCGGCPLASDYEEQARLAGRRRRQRRRRPGRDHRRRCSSSTSSATCRGRTSTSPRPATRPRTGTSGARARPASAPGCCSSGSAARTPRRHRKQASMNGLTVRWSLADAAPGVEDELATYVADDVARPLHRDARAALTRPGGCVPGEWFEGCYVFADDAARAAFQDDVHRGRGASRPGSQIIGTPPVLIEPCDDRRGGRGCRRASRPTPRALSTAHSGLGRPLLLGDAAARRRPAAAPGPGSSSSRDLADELADRDGLGVALRRVGDPVVPQRVVEGHHAAGPEQPQRLARGRRRTRPCRRRRTPGRSGRRSAGAARRARRRRWCGPAGSGCRPR